MVLRAKPPAKTHTVSRIQGILQRGWESIPLDECSAGQISDSLINGMATVRCSLFKRGPGFYSILELNSMELKEVQRYPGRKGQRLECQMFVMVPGPLAPHGWVTDTDVDISGLCTSAGCDRRVVLRVPAA